jgi:di/tricarboxylate transporter
MDFTQWAVNQGPLGILILIFATAYMRKYIYTGREYALLLETLERERKENEKERDELKRELGFWRDISWTASKLADHVVGQLPAKDST